MCKKNQALTPIGSADTRVITCYHITSTPASTISENGDIHICAFHKGTNMFAVQVLITIQSNAALSCGHDGEGKEPLFESWGLQPSSATTAVPILLQQN